MNRIKLAAGILKHDFPMLKIHRRWFPPNKTPCINHKLLKKCRQFEMSQEDYFMENEGWTDPLLQYLADTLPLDVPKIDK